MLKINEDVLNFPVLSDCENDFQTNKKPSEWVEDDFVDYHAWEYVKNQMNEVYHDY